MGLYIQQGYGKGTRLQPLLQSQIAEGWILSPYDESPAALAETARAIAPSPARLLLDAQTWIHSIDGSNTFKLADHGLQIPNFQLGMSAAEVQSHTAAAVELADRLDADVLLAPTVIQNGLQDAWTGLALQFARTASQSFSRATFASVLFEEHALSDWQAVSRWLNQITAIDEIRGVYLCPVRTVAGPYPYQWADAQRLANLLSVVRRLAANDLEVIVGYQDVEGLAMLAAGATALASGWSVNRRVLIRERWVPQTGGAQPVVRIWLRGVLASIRRDDAITASGDQSIRGLLLAEDLVRLQEAQGRSTNASQLDYLNDLGEVARTLQADPDAIDGLLEGARTNLGVMRSRIPPLETIHAQRIAVMQQALQLFRARESI